MPKGIPKNGVNKGWFIKNGNINEKNINWKGGSASYSAIHYWIEGKLGNIKYCEHCKSIKKKKYEWANIDHKYRRLLKDYIRLCTSCHRKYDHKNHLSNIGSRSGSVKNKI